MPRTIKKRSDKAGLPPGALIHIGEQRAENVRIKIVNYDEAQFQELEVSNVEECLQFKDKPNNTWINIDGIHQVDTIEKIGLYFNLHPLLLEDILNTDQRPKVEDYGDYIFIVLKMLFYDDQENKTKAEQVSLVLGANFLISFKEMGGDIFDSIRERIKNGQWRARKMGVDYLAYSLMDVIVDHYFTIMEKIGEKTEDLEEKLVTDAQREAIRSIQDFKREMMFIRKSVWPLREVVNIMERGGSPLIHESTYIYLRDVYDHTIQVIDTVETYRDILSGMLDIYLSSINNKLNEVMKVLTVIATIFIPLTFIVGLYGMNFEYMPELKVRWAYPAILICMAVIAISMLAYFKKKKWF